MRETIFRKAIKNLEFLELKGTWHNKEFYEYVFKDTSQNIENYLTVEDNKTKLSCTCKHCSTNGSTSHEIVLCSYKLGVLLFKFKKGDKTDSSNNKRN